MAELSDILQNEGKVKEHLDEIADLCKSTGALLKKLEHMNGESKFHYYDLSAPDGQNWGEATKNFVPLGEHSSSQDEPRLGLGNLAQIFGSWCGLLEFLGFPCT